MAKLAYLVNQRRNDNKKSVCLAAIEIKPGDLEAGVEEVAVNLPERAVIKAIYSVTEAAHDGGIISVQSYDATDTADGVVDLDIDQAAEGVTANLLPDYVYTGSGMQLKMSAAALQTVGVVQVCIVYDEPSLSTGMLTSV